VWRAIVLADQPLLRNATVSTGLPRPLPRFSATGEGQV